MTNLNLSVLNGRNGFIIQGVAQDGRLGDSVSNAGDLNGDGLPDILVGARDVDITGENNEGQVSVIFGSDSNFDGRLEVSSLDGSNGFNINGFSREQRLGFSVSNAGDVNSDNVDDIIIGANGTNSNRGDSYIIFGNSGIGNGIDLLALDGSNGFKVDGIIEGDRLGEAVTNAGDLNGDGIDDVAVAASFVEANGNDNAGATYVVFGQDGGFPDDLDLTTLDGTNGFVINGADFNDFSGRSLSSAGDLNGDGVDDLLIGAPLADPGDREDAGTTYVVFGQQGGFNAELNLDSLNGTNGFTINGIDAGDASGTAISALGDINNDGFSDIGIGAPAADVSNGETTNENAGEGYVIFGSNTGFTEGFFFLSSLDGSNGFTVNGINVDDQLGTAISGVGDVNNDEIDDFIISAVGAEEGAGTSYVIFGTEAGFAGTLNLADLNINRGFAIDGIVGGEGLTDRSGESVSNLGDVNNDGIDDLLIGAPQASPRIGEDLEAVRDAGEAYVVFGRIENLGDADADGAYTDNDTYLISRVAVGLDAEFAAYPGIDPLLVADVNSDGFLSALDSAIVNSTANGGTSNFILPDISG